MRTFSAKSAALATAMLAAAMVQPRLSAQAPQSAAARVQDIEGVLEVVVEDAPNSAAIHHFLKTANERIELHGRPDSGDLQNLVTDTRVKVHGRRVDANTIDLGGGGGSVTTMALAAPNTFGQQRVAVIMVNFQDDTSQQTDYASANDVVFNQVNDFYLKNSYNQTWLTGDVFGFFTIPMSVSVCDVTTLQNLADSAATKAGANLGNYNRIVYSFPRNGCTWWGTGNIGGNPSRAWIKGTFSLKVVAHEMGHNFGDFHSNSMPCTDGVCTATEYGDDRDIMGLSGTGHMHAYQKERLGWLNYGSSPTIQSVTSSGSFFIGSLDTGGSPSALKILKSSSSTDKTYYYIEARTPDNYDAPYGGGVILHTGNLNNGNSAYQVDLDPLGSGFDAVLDPGQTFTDSAAGLTVTTISADGSGAWVQITYAGQPCNAGTPSVTLSPGSSVTSPMTASAYTMTVKNNDGSSCSTSAFNIGMSVPSGWNWSSAQPTLNVGPGGTAGTTVYVTPPSGASGSNGVSASANRSASSGPSGSANATLTVASGLSVSLSITGGANYQVSATVLAGSSPIPGVAVTILLTDPKGAVNSFTATTNVIGVATVKGKLKGRDPRGTYNVLVTVSSGALTGSASGSFVY